MALKYYTNEFRYLDKDNNCNERDNYSSWIIEQIDIYGQKLDYHVLNYSLTGHDPIYGEQPAAKYSNAVRVVMYVELNEQSTYLSKFGLQGDDDVTAFIPITKFQSSLSGVANYEGNAAEPKSGDVFTLVEYGNDRVGGRNGKSFEITQRLDQEVSTLNPLMGHYVWMIKAKRLDYTFNPNLTAEGKSNQVYDNNFAGALSGYTTQPAPAKVYTSDADTEAKTIFDYTTTNNDDVYGDYN